MPWKYKSVTICCSIPNLARVCMFPNFEIADILLGRKTATVITFRYHSSFFKKKRKKLTENNSLPNSIGLPLEEAMI